MREMRYTRHAAPALYVALVFALTGILIHTAGTSDRTAPAAALAVGLLSVLIVLWVRQP